MKFSVSAVIPENQNDKNQSYFNLKMQPGQKQILKVKLRNSTNKEVIVITSANTAITNSNGITDYSTTNSKLDNTLKIPFSKITKVNQETKIPAKSTVTLEVEIKMPKEPFDGVILGGLYFKEKEEFSKSNNQSSGVQIKNQYAYVIGVLISESEKEIKPDLKLNEIKPTQKNSRNVITANLQNIEPAMLRDLSVDAKIYKEKGKKVLHETKKENLRMAPNSNFDYAISWDDQEFVSGKYRIEMIASDGDKTWKWTRTFTIKGEAASKFNDSAVDLQKDYKKWYIFGGSFLLLILLIFVFYLGRRSKKKENK